MALPSFERVRELVRKELIQVVRDPRLLRMVIVAPILQLLAFGYAVSTDVRATPTYVVDQDNTAASRDLTTTFFASEYFHHAGASDRPRDLVAAIDRGDAMVGLVIPRGFARAAGRNAATVQVVLRVTRALAVSMAARRDLIPSSAARRSTRNLGCFAGSTSGSCRTIPSMPSAPRFRLSLSCLSNKSRSD